MMYPSKCFSLFIITAIFFISFQFSSSTNDTITASDKLKDGDVIVSKGQVFALGFFSPGNSRNRFVGIWYHQIPEKTVVWVANRNDPVNDTSGVLTVSGDGKLVVYGTNQVVPVWSTTTNISVKGEVIIARLLDSGNLVLVRNDTKGNDDDDPLWQSFDFPTNTLLPFMKLGIDYRTGLNLFLTSWRSPDDPGTGNWSYRIDPTGFPQMSLYKGSELWWRSGSWTGERWSGVPQMSKNYLFNVSFVNDQNQTSVVYAVTKPKILTRMILNETGFMQRFTWNPNNSQWIGFWTSPEDQCDYYGHCGQNSNCDSENTDKFECTCLPGFKPKSPQDWYLRDGSNGCIRKDEESVCKKGAGFVKVASVKVPDTSIAHVDMNLSLKMCQEKCLSNCSCTAYASAYVYQGRAGVGCLNWHGNLIDTRIYVNSGQDLFVRADAIELAGYAHKGALDKKGLLAVLIVSIIAVIVCVAFVFWLVKKRRQGQRRFTSKYPFSNHSTDYFENSRELDECQTTSDLPLFDLKTVALATNHFSFNNKLGEGGFGPVYKGVLPNGVEIAAKRLSKYSGQGIEEFKNEIALLAKLQHRNLVRILGCCIDKEEKMLIYEYLDNKSLDAFIFVPTDGDKTKRSFLDWNRRFEIILGIARGILYLHQDSRLRIIHRDLKASNILLDSGMNPKISDFGMARICGGDQIAANTNRVVGTYGYMSPEYAMEGLFSIKSDVYSFGVLVLEIVTGRKNSGHYPDSPSSNLVGHVWELWKEGKASEIIDSSLGDSCSKSEVLRCIEIGLLCVQEHAADRPTMSEIVSMLSNGNALPSPRQPAFIIKRKFGHGDSTTGTSSSTEGYYSVNDVTVSIVQGR